MSSMCPGERGRRPGALCRGLARELGPQAALPSQRGEWGWWGVLMVLMTLPVRASAVLKSPGRRKLAKWETRLVKGLLMEIFYYERILLSKQ